MTPYTIMTVTFDNYDAVKRLIGQLVDVGLNIGNFSVVGKVGQDCQMKHRETCGTFWGDLSVLLPERVCLTLPSIGPVVVLGHLGSMLVSVIEATPERKVVDESFSALGTALFHYGLPKDDATECEAAVNANRLLVIGYGTTDEIEQAAAVLKEGVPESIITHTGV